MRPLPFDLEDLRAFAAVVETGGFARASSQIGVSKSVLSRRVASLEFALGAQMLVRDQRGARATDAGAALHRIAAEVLARLDEVRDEAIANMTQLAGTIRITAPLSFGVLHLSPALAAFAAAHPEVDLDVRLDDRMVDLLTGGFDLGIRVGAEPDPDIVVRRLAPVRPYLLASPEYLDRRGRPSKPADLVGHDALDYANAEGDLWRVWFGDRINSSDLNVRLRSDNGEILRDAAAAGVGLVVLPDFLVTQKVAMGALEIVMPDHRLSEAGVYAISPPGRPKLRRVRALIDHLATAFGSERVREL